ncbi:MAG: hypothetical protein PHP95_06110 [Desulfuromonadaceae bacterium]|nr:hypothetical protein [Desulfuromonadaceae bacterium]MDD2848013.1 hypothetical protein [Desulfuromonadaceae bacterium]MDD4131245.1 hypothetical protein [Desulfuromonadaceae bacterium]
MKSLSVFIMLAVMPCSVYADCIITDTSEKFEIVCSGPDPVSPAGATKNTRKAPRTGKRKKLDYEERAGAMQAVVMNDAESRFMELRNQQDGYRSKRRNAEQTTKKTVAGPGRNI